MSVHTRSITRLMAATLALLSACCGAALAGDIVVRGRVLAADGSPAPEVIVSVMRSEGVYSSVSSHMSGVQPGKLVASTLTREAGDFELRLSEAGVYEVLVEAAGHVPLRSELGPTVGSRNLPDATLVTDEGLLVRVIDEEGAPLAGALATLGPRQSRAPRFSAPSGSWSVPRRSLLTDAEGIAFFPRALDSRETLTLHAPGRKAHVARNHAGGHVEVTLPVAKESAIRVLDDSGRPTPDALVLLGDQRVPVASTDEAGRALVPLAAGSSSHVHVVAPDGRGARARVESAGDDGEQAPRVIRLPEVSRVAGRVIDAESGRALVGALVTTGEGGAFALSGRGGVFEIASGGASELTLLAQAPGYLPARPYSYPVGSANFDPTLALSPAASAEGVVLDESGEPLAGVRINLEEKRGASGMMTIEIHSGGAREAQGLSDSQGRFIVEGIDPAKSWTLVATREGLVTTRQDLRPLRAHELTSGLTLTMKTGLSASGRVTDKEGRPLRGAEVSLVPAKPEASHGMMMIRMGDEGEAGSSALTDGEGRFVVSGLEEGPHDLKITREGYARHESGGIELSADTELAELGDFALAIGEVLQGLVIDEGGLPIEGVAVSRSQGAGLAWFGAGATLEEPDAVTGPDGWFTIDGLAEGETLSLSLTREGYVSGKAPQLVVPLVEPLTVTLDPSSTVSGVVLDPEGQPVPGATVTLNRRVSATMGNNQITMMTREGSEADRDGAFAFDGLPPGEIGLEASAPGYEHTTRTLTIERGSDLEGVEMPLEPGAVVRGRVFASDGSPAVGARVGPVGDESNIGGGGEPTAVSDGEGRYVLDGVPEGKISIEAHSETGQRAVREIEARTGLNDLDLRFEGGQRVSGIVTDPAGAPIAGAFVSLQPAGRYWGGPEARSGSNGSFEFEGVSDGDYRAVASHDDHALSERVSVTVAGQPVNEIRIPLREGFALEGRVVGLSPERLVKVSIDAYAVGGNGFQETRVGSDGRFRLEGLAPGEWEIRAAVDGGGARTSARATVESGGAGAPVELLFEGGHTLSGRATQAGRALAGVSIYASGENVDSGGWAETDASGRFSIENLDKGEYTLTLRQWDTGLSHEESFDLRGDDQVTIDVPTARITGRVVDGGDGGPVAGVRVALERADDPGSANPLFGMGGTSDLDGGFQIVPVTEGDYRLVASKEGFATTTTSVSISGDRSLDDVEIELEASEGLSLQVTLASGGFPDEISYALIDPAGVPLSSGRHGTGEGGLVRLSKVPPGSWELVVSGGGSASLSLDVQAPGGPIPVTLPRTTSLEVRVNELAESGGLARVQVFDRRGRLFRGSRWYGQPQSEWELRSGRAQIAGLPAGAYEVVVTAPDGRTWKGSATTSESSTAQLVLD